MANMGFEMMNRGSFNDFLSSIFKRSDWLRNRDHLQPGNARGIADLCRALLATGGEASAIAFAADVLEGYQALDMDARREFFELLADEFDLETDRLQTAVSAYAENATPPLLAELITAAEPERQELFRRLNTAPGGTAALVKMRADLLAFIKQDSNLKRVDADLRHLLTSWFNRGFLLLESIDWHSSADILEKVIAYESVHEIHSWDELRRRLQPDDRRCFAFFHPAMPDEPLIFVEIALTKGVPSSIQELLDPEREKLSAASADTAVFYSISNCQLGLAGISFGNFLIKQVAADLREALPNLSTFVTLSPVPGLMRWMKNQDDENSLEHTLCAALENIAPQGDSLEPLNPALQYISAKYFLEKSRPDGKPIDPVARFHLGNGAQLYRINPSADLSENGMRQSAGIMVNYLYDLSAVEGRHEAYARSGKVDAADKVRALLRRPASLPTNIS